MPYEEAVGEAAFYGPKLDVEVKPAVGPEVTLSTCQLDFLLPRRFELNYIDANGEKQVPVVIHRAIFGTFDRFTAFLIEETKGAFPLWLAPRQIVIVPVNAQIHSDYAYRVKEELVNNGFRVEVDDRNEKLGYRIREAQMKKTPIALVVGDGEIQSQSVNVRRYGVKENSTMPLNEFVKMVNDEVSKFRF